jgi:hypothetical protein
VKSSEKVYTVGLELGVGAEPTAIAILERRRVEPDDPHDQRQPVYSLRHLHRYPPGTAYPAIFANVVEMLRSGPLPGAWLLADYTGVGFAVLRLLLQGLRGQVSYTFTAVTLTAGRGIVNPVIGELNVAKTELIGLAQSLLQTRRLLVARELPDTALLVRELKNYRPRVTLAPADVTAGRDGIHDDLLLATALAALGGERALTKECCRDRKTAWKA